MREIVKWVTSSGEFIRDRRWTATTSKGEIGHIDVLISQQGHIEFRANVRGCPAVRRRTLPHAQSVIHRAWLSETSGASE